MAHLVGAPASIDRNTTKSTPIAGWLTAMGGPALVVLVIAGLARLFDPGYGSTPLISSHARGYYLVAFIILGIAIAAEIVRRTLAAPTLPVCVASWTLLIGAATLVAVEHTGPRAVFALVAIAAADGWSRERTATDGPLRTADILDRALAVALLWLLLFGLLEFHLRWILALPLVGVAGALGLIRFESINAGELERRLPEMAVVALATMQLVIALSFLHTSAATGATVILVSLAAIHCAATYWTRTPDR